MANEIKQIYVDGVWRTLKDETARNLFGQAIEAKDVAVAAQNAALAAQTLAETAQTAAETAKTNAQTAAAEAAAAATVVATAEAAATAANAAADAATAATSSANTAASAANTAAGAANDAADKLEDVDATATTLAAGASATATVSTVDGHYRISIGVPQGTKGDKGDTGDPAPTADVAGAVTSWLDENVNPVGSAVVVDSSLSVSGAAADAAKTGELKSAIDAVTDQTNLFNKNAVTDGKRLDGSGAPTNGTDYYVSEYIPVQAGCYYYKNSPINDAYHRMCVYTEDFTFITGEIYTENFVQIPSTGAYIRICGLKTEKDTTVIKAMIAIDFSTREAIAKFETYLIPKNIFDGKFSDGFLGTNGQVNASDSYVYSTDYIPVNAGEVLTWWFYSTTQSAITSATVRFVTAYDITKTAISASGASSTTHSYTVPDGIAYIRFTYSNNSTKASVMCAVNESGTPSKYEAYFEPYYGFSDNVDGHYTIRKKVSILATDGIDGFYSKMSAAYELGNCDVNIEQGTYTYTNALIEAIRATGRRGIPIGNGCKYYFNGAKIYCEYTGSSVSDIVNFFSPLDSQNVASDYEIHNLDLVAKNVVYGIHDEANGGNFCRHIYEDCNIELDNTYLGSENGNAISKALGGGLAAYEEVIIRNCVFKATNPAHTTQYQNDASYHGANGSTFTDAKIVVDGCYFENIFRCSNLGVNTSTPYPKIIYTNNSCSGRNVDLPGNWKVYAWNNELRT